MTPTERAIAALPAHLRRFVVAQDHASYTPRDHAVWRHILRRLTAHLATRAHPRYLAGLAATGKAVYAGRREPGEVAGVRPRREVCREAPEHVPPHRVVTGSVCGVILRDHEAAQVRGKGRDGALRRGHRCLLPFVERAAGGCSGHVVWGPPGGRHPGEGAPGRAPSPCPREGAGLMYPADR